MGNDNRKNSGVQGQSQHLDQNLAWAQVQNKASERQAMPGGDKRILRELAKACAELAAHPANAERERRIRDMHGLKPVRPPVWVDEIPWHEMDVGGQLAERCETAPARDMERYFRRLLFRWKYFQADMIVEDAYYVTKAYDATESVPSIREETVATDRNNAIISHHYEDQLETEDKLELLRIPTITARPDVDAASLDAANDALDGAMPVRLRGHSIYHAPWDVIARLRGVENCLIDFIERPDFIHKIIGRFTEIALSKYEQMEAAGLMDFSRQSLHCTPPYADELPAKDYDGGKVRLRDVWFRGMAQMLTTVSPQQYFEFDLQYSRRLMEKCGLSYYGCCEPLHRIIPYLKQIPNMRKIGVSPWADVASSAEQIGGGYVFARKPNPALVAGEFDADAVRRETAEVIEACIEHKCPYEFVLKDISTVGYRPQNLIDWTDTVMRTIDGYY